MNHPKHSVGPACAGCDSRLLEADGELRRFFYHFKSLYQDLHCSWAYRGEAEQNAALAHGVSNAKWGESKHNVLPSKAIDLFEITKGTAIFDPKFCMKLHKEALDAGFKVINGGSFKIRKKGKLVSLGDFTHYELDED